jgi:chromosomal replication initiator protein
MSDGCGKDVSRETPTVAACMALAARAYGAGIGDLVGQSRRSALVRPRHIAMWIARRATNQSLPQIGRAFGGRDHTTVLHAVRRIERLREKHPGLKQETDALLALARDPWGAPFP